MASGILGSTVLTLEELIHLPFISNYQYVLVEMKVKVILCVTGPLIPEYPQHGSLIILIKHIAYINDWNPPVIVLVMVLPHQMPVVNPTFNSSLHKSSQMLHTSSLVVLSFCDMKDIIFH